MAIVYLNGNFIPQEEAKISIMDRGFLFGDGVYEVIPVYNGHMLRFDQHLRRLKKSLQSIFITPPLTNEEWFNILKKLLELNQKSQGIQNLYLQITRGPQENRNHEIPEHYVPTVLAFLVTPKIKPPEVLQQGFTAITLDDSRRRDCYIKAITLLPNILLYEQARRSGAAEAILIRNGEAIEGTSSNLFIVMKDTLITPPLTHSILGGITRELIIELAKKHDIPVKEAVISLPMLKSANEIWLTGSSKEILPVVRIDGEPVGNGLAGPLWYKMIGYYDQHKKQALQKRT